MCCQTIFTMTQVNYGIRVNPHFSRPPIFVVAATGRTSKGSINASQSRVRVHHYLVDVTR